MDFLKAFMDQGTMAMTDEVILPNMKCFLKAIVLQRIFSWDEFKAVFTLPNKFRQAVVKNVIKQADIARDHK